MTSGKLLNSTTVYQGRTIALSVDDVELPNGRRSKLEVVHHPGAAAIVPIDNAGNVLLVRQYRHAASEWLLEVPAGKVDRGETFEQCAARETEEETGFRPTELISLGIIWTTPGFTDERIALFLAHGLVESQQNLDEDETVDVVRLPLATAVAQALSGEICDSKSVSALLRAKHWLDRS